MLRLLQLVYKEFKVHITTETQEALQLAQKHLPDLIFSDMNMPDINGADFVKQLKSLPNLEDVPVIFLTGNQLSHEQCQSMGINAYLQKPCKPQQIYEIGLPFLKD